MSTDTRSQSSVGIGVGVGAALVLLVAVGVLGVGLFCVWRRHPSKVVPALASSEDMGHLNNPVYESELVWLCLKISKKTITGEVCSSHSADYELAGSHPSHNSVVIQFDNPLYAEGGPTVSKEGDCNKLAMVSCDFLSPMGILYTYFFPYMYIHDSVCNP